MKKMKWLLSFALAALICASPLTAQGAIADTMPIEVTPLPIASEGSYRFAFKDVYDSRPLFYGHIYTKDSVSMIPARALFRSLGYSYSFDREAGEAIALQNAQWFLFTVGERNVNFGRAVRKMDTSPVIIGGQLYLPISFMMDVVAYDIAATPPQYNEHGRILFIERKGNHLITNNLRPEQKPEYPAPSRPLPMPIEPTTKPEIEHPADNSHRPSLPPR